MVARSLDGRGLLLGEVKWREDAVTQEDLRRYSRELAAKGIPPIDGRPEETQIVRAVFVPETAGPRGALPDGCRVVTARGVVRALG